jgi:hypothetical protein
MLFCVDCMFSDFRLSHLRRYDLPELLLLRWPLRCQRCGLRTYGSFYLAFLLFISRGREHGRRQASHSGSPRS